MIEVNRQTVLSVLHSMEKGREKRSLILKRHGIDLDGEENWFPHQKWLESFKEIEGSLGPTNLMLIGRAIIKSADFPKMKDLEEALRSINIAYHMNHRKNGKVMFKNGRITSGIGDYKLSKFDSQRKEAEIICTNPYPSKFDEGIISQIVKQFKPLGSREVVEIDPEKETRKNGGKSCTFLIRW